MSGSLEPMLRAFTRGLTGDDPAPALALLRPLRGRAPLLGVYRHAYRARMSAALRDNHPVLHRVLGDEAFDALAADYLAAHPSQRASIRWFGDGLAEAIAMGGMPHAAALADLARFEWTLGQVLDDPDAPALDAQTLQSQPPEAWATLPLRLHPAARLLALDWDITPLWQALQADEQAQTAQPAARPHQVLVWRQGLARHWRIVDEDEAQLLHTLAEGTSIGALCTVAAAHSPDAADAAPARVAASLHRWLADGVLT
ncbi:putative DNA-binding domain-containing protein [Ideonella sp. 4Y16]|uniref:DNA-binding domain-containing protein n=1 Tax=Ideonella alba TaxID=2824118 RepID=A0A940YBJ0_9BURK|nr:DNA-binding domain-containing protein [Ideonella alba]MBQ0931630.1 putative DNA-binding domain-containing protein [Ideonella alba]MBQ0944064.1 putative DNA-binding domain-containing protein [Ideonella alba]